VIGSRYISILRINIKQALFEFRKRILICDSIRINFDFGTFIRFVLCCIRDQKKRLMNWGVDRPMVLLTSELEWQTYPCLGTVVLPDSTINLLYLKTVNGIE